MTDIRTKLHTPMSRGSLIIVHQTECQRILSHDLQVTYVVLKKYAIFVFIFLEKKIFVFFLPHHISVDHGAPLTEVRTSITLSLLIIGN
jgi:hypothetical protein